MRKRAVTALLSVLFLSLCACGKNDAGEVPEEPAAAVTEETVQNEPAATEEKDPAEEAQAADASEDSSLEMNVASIELTSEDLKDGVWNSVISKTGGSNVSPQLSWDAVDGADSYVIYMVDNTASHWMHWKSANVKETQLPQGWASSSEYVGPYPPSGTHEYQIYVIALKEPVSKIYGSFDSENLKFEEKKYGCDLNDGEQPGNILAIGTITGTYTAGDMAAEADKAPGDQSVTGQQPQQQPAQQPAPQPAGNSQPAQQPADYDDEPLDPSIDKQYQDLIDQGVIIVFDPSIPGDEFADW